MSNGMLVNAQSRFDIYRLQREHRELKSVLNVYRNRIVSLEEKLEKLTKDFLDLKENIEIEEVIEEITETVDGYNVVNTS
tara:strand:+ start:968 stop:1207 length:240 start_codon:yes stop_codon:yes gene_type:complete